MATQTKKAPSEKKLKAHLVKQKKLLQKRVVDALTGKGKKQSGSAKKNEDGLTANQEKFCFNYASDREFFGNGTQSYIDAFNIDVGIGKGKTSIETCRYRAHELLTNPNVLDRIEELCESAVLNDQFVDKQLAFLIAQHAEFRPKLGAIQEYNKLKGRIRERIELGFADDDTPDSDLKAKKAELEAFFKKQKITK